MRNASIRSVIPLSRTLIGRALAQAIDDHVVAMLLIAEWPCAALIETGENGTKLHPEILDDAQQHRGASHSAQREMEILVLCERRGEILLPFGLDVAGVDRRELLCFRVCRRALALGEDAHVTDLDAAVEIERRHRHGPSLVHHQPALENEAQQRFRHRRHADAEIAGDLARGAGIVYIDVDRKVAGFFETMTADDNIYVGYLASTTRRRLLYPLKERKTVADRGIRNLAISALKRALRIIEYSGGNQQKVVVAKSLALEPSLVIFNEPSRGVDVGAIPQIHAAIRALAAEAKAVVVISSYLPEVLAISIASWSPAAAGSWRRWRLRRQRKRRSCTRRCIDALPRWICRELPEQRNVL